MEYYIYYITRNPFLVNSGLPVTAPLSPSVLHLLHIAPPPLWNTYQEYLRKVVCSSVSGLTNRIILPLSLWLSTTQFLLLSSIYLVFPGGCAILVKIKPFSSSTSEWEVVFSWRQCNPSFLCRLIPLLIFCSILFFFSCFARCCCSSCNPSSLLVIASNGFGKPNI